ncbi:TPA: hypothetical protein G8O67_005080 [Salmonella enterica]|uniref:DUF4145 domain-containing protein n=1 Tax=Salmonella enterica TaxID=28901 RepID=A0A756I6Q8_SALER|nr:hypothetical protein [Salmonella enterica]
MNVFIFANHLTSININDLYLKAMLMDDDIGTTLRLHLISERVVESWICASCGYDSVFVNKKNPVKMDAIDKINMAINMGFPAGAGRALQVLNALRNDIAHNPLKSSIPDSRIQSLAEITNNYLISSGWKPLKDLKAEIFDEQGKLQTTITIESSCANRLKLCLIFSQILSAILELVVKEHPVIQLSKSQPASS